MNKKCMICGKLANNHMDNFHLCEDHSYLIDSVGTYSDNNIRGFAKDHNLCYFNECWSGICGKPVLRDGMCEHHAHQKCFQCGEQATRNCDVASSLVCGMPECDKHSHSSYH